MKKLWFACWLLCGWIFAGCAPVSTPNAVGGALTPLPTLTLIRVPATPTPLPPTQTPTLQALFRPADLITPTAFSPAVAMAQLAQADVGLANVQVAYVAARTWRDPQTLDCENTSPVPITTRGTIDGYEVILLVGGDVYVYHTDDEATVIQCSAQALSDVPGDLLIKFDPVAADLLAVAQRDLAQRLGVPLRQVQLGEMQLMVWQDASLGCPRAGQTYTDMRITGYRIVLTTGTQDYPYHTDFDRAVPCESP